MIARKADIAILDVRRFDEYATMNIPGAVSVPGAELLLRAAQVAPDPETMIVVNCAGRTRSIIGTQSLINAGIPNKVVALRNGTIGWTLAGLDLEHGMARRGGIAAVEGAKARARDVAYRAGVRHLGLEEAMALETDHRRTLYRFDVRPAEDYAAGHIPGFAHYPGGQLVQEIDMAAPVRGARILLTDNMGVRADMSASWLAQMGGKPTCSMAATIARSKSNRRRFCRSRIRRIATGGPTKAPISRPGQCRPTSIGSMVWSSSFGVTPPMGSS